MTTLTDTQLVILSTAAQREDGGVILPERLKGNAAKTTTARLITLGLIEEVGAAGSLPVWRRDDEGSFALRITPAGLAAIGVEPDGIEPSPMPDGDAEAQSAGDETAASASPPSASMCQPRAGTKQALVVALLSQSEGASLDELVAASGWLPHTTRAALTGLRRKGYAITKAKGETGPTRYRIVGQGGAFPDGSAEQVVPATEPVA